MFVNDIEGRFPELYNYDLRDQLKRHVYARSDAAFVAGEAARDTIKTPAALDAYRRDMRKKFIRSLGGLPSSATPLNARTVGTISEKGFRIEKVIFESRPKAFVTANLYVPDGIRSPRGAVLFVCGHHERAKHEPEYQIVCRYLVAAGLVVLAQDPVGQGERFSYYEKSIGGATVASGVLEHEYAGTQCLLLGDCIGRYFVHDAMRGIDYLCSRPEVDSKKIGVTGNSGGGTQTSLMMMCDPRVAAAAPGTFLMNRQTFQAIGCPQDAEQIWAGMTAVGWDHEDILLMTAPKPVCVLAVTSDFFPIEGTRRTVERCRRFWKMCGRPNDLVLAEDFSTHKYTRVLAKTAAKFFARHLLKTDVTINDAAIDAIEPARLWCTTSGQVRGEIPGAKFVYEENLERYNDIQRQRKGHPAPRHKAGLAWLKKRVFSDRQPCDLNPRFYFDERLDDLHAPCAFWRTQEGLFNHGRLFRNIRFDGRKLPVIIALWDNGTKCLQPHMTWIRRMTDAGRAVLVLDVSGTGNLLPNPLSILDPNHFFGVVHKLNDDLLWLDDSMAALRVYDVIRALDLLELWPGLDAGDTRAYAHGRQGLYLQLAAAVDKRIRGLDVVDGVRSISDWVTSRHFDVYGIHSVIIPGMLKYYDLPHDKAKGRKG